MVPIINSKRAKVTMVYQCPECGGYVCFTSKDVLLTNVNLLDMKCAFCGNVREIEHYKYIKTIFHDDEGDR